MKVSELIEMLKQFPQHFPLLTLLPLSTFVH
jgi:hypothetical protein